MTLVAAAHDAPLRASRNSFNPPPPRRRITRDMIDFSSSSSSGIHRSSGDDSDARRGTGRSASDGLLAACRHHCVTDRRLPHDLRRSHLGRGHAAHHRHVPVTSYPRASSYGSGRRPAIREVGGRIRTSRRVFSFVCLFVVVSTLRTKVWLFFSSSSSSSIRASVSFLQPKSSR